MDERRFSEKIDPVHLEAEMALVGACLTSPEGRWTAIQDVKPEDFWTDACRTVFEVVLALDATGQAVDLITVSDWLNRNKAESRITYDFLTSCINTCLYNDHPDSYIKLIKEKSERRKFLTVLRQTIEDVRNQNKPLDEVRAEHESKLFDMKGNRAQVLDPVSWAEQVETEAALLEQGIDNRRRVRTGYHYIDKKLKLWPRKMSVVAGHTSGGKTATALCLAASAALRNGHRVVIYSLEMDSDELYERLAAAECDIDYGRIQDRRLTVEERHKIKDAMARIKASKLIIRDALEKPWSAAAIRADARYIQHTEGQVDLIVIDYLLLMEDLNSTVEGSDRRDLRVGNIVWNLIRLAKDLDCHVMLLHQFNRENSRRTTSRPKLSDLKESSAIEQHAHNVVLLYRPERDEAYEEEDRAAFAKMLEFIIAKQRAGQVGSVWLTFEGDKQKIVSLHHDQWKKLPTPKMDGKRR